MSECKCNYDLPPEGWAKVDEIIERYKAKPGSLIPLLEDLQEAVGYLPAEVQGRVAERLNLSRALVYGVVSFYSFFTMVPRGKHLIKVCLGTACYVKRSDEILEKIKNELNVAVGGMTEDKKYSLEGVRCVGACGLAPVVVVNNDTYGAVDPVKVMEIIRKYE